YSVQQEHLHLVVETESKTKLALHARPRDPPGESAQRPVAPAEGLGVRRSLLRLGAEEHPADMAHRALRTEQRPQARHVDEGRRSRSLLLRPLVPAVAQHQYLPADSELTRRRAAQLFLLAPPLDRRCPWSALARVHRCRFVARLRARPASSPRLPIACVPPFTAVLRRTRGALRGFTTRDSPAPGGRT